MKKDFYYIDLYEIYKGLLTEKQSEMFYSHYLLDLSYAEIAETEGTMRQSVYDAIKKVKAKLDEYENLLRLKEKFDGLNEIAKEVGGEVSNKITEIVGR